MAKIKEFFNTIREMNKFEWMVILLGLFLLPTLMFFEFKALKKGKSYSEIKNRLKYFEPTITETIWSKSVSWKMRERPLTDIELDELLKNDVRL